jgi:hypothetical protein
MDPPGGGGNGMMMAIIVLVLLLCGGASFYFLYYRYTNSWTIVNNVTVDSSLTTPGSTAVSLYTAQKTAYSNNNPGFFVTANGTNTYDVYYYPSGSSPTTPVSSTSSTSSFYLRKGSSALPSTGGGGVSPVSTGGGGGGVSPVSTGGGGVSPANTDGPSATTANPYAQFVNVNITPTLNDIAGGGGNMTTRQCQAACDGNPSCKAFVMGGTDGKTCYLKSVSGPTVITGDINTAYIRPLAGMKYAYINQHDMNPGNHDTSGGPAKTDPIAGASACDANPACQGFVINNMVGGGGGTYLKTDTGTYSTGSIPPDPRWPWVSNAFVKATNNLLNLNAPFYLQHVQSGKYVAYDSANKLSGCADAGMAGSFNLVASMSSATPITASLNTGLYRWDSSGVVALKIGTNQFITHCDMWLLTTTVPPTNSGGDHRPGWDYGWKFIPVPNTTDTYITYNYYNNCGIEIGTDSGQHLTLGGTYTPNNQAGEIPLSTTQWKIVYQ